MMIAKFGRLAQEIFTPEELAELREIAAPVMADLSAAIARMMEAKREAALREIVRRFERGEECK